MISAQIDPYLETPPTSTNTAKKEEKASKQNHIGVADYFAVLGVGQDLIWKHAQQSPEDDNQEDDAMLLERFYREIVDLTIFVAEEEDNPHSAAATPTATTVYNKNHQFAVTLGSPSPSDVTSAVGTQVETEAMEGWTIVQQTRPLSNSPISLNPTRDNLPTSPSRSSFNPTWQKTQTWDANLDPLSGLTSEIQTQFSQQKEKSSTPLKDLRRKVKSTFQQRMHLFSRIKTKYYLSYRRRAPDESHRPAVADMALAYVQIHRATIPIRDADRQSSTTSSVSYKGAAALLRAAEVGKQAVQSRVLRTTPSWNEPIDFSDLPPVSLQSLIDIPSGYDELSIPYPYQELRFPLFRAGTPFSKTMLFSGDEDSTTESSEVGVEAVDKLPTEETWQQQIKPKLVSINNITEDEEYINIPILAIRRQRVGNEERYHEDPAITDVAVMFCDDDGIPIMPADEIDEDEDEHDETALNISSKTAWEVTGFDATKRKGLGTISLAVRKNIPLGFCDAAFSTRVMDRFPYKNYKGLPLPEEELPMFCYPTGCRLHRAKFCEAPLPQHYGFVVKNERGDSIYVSCVSFMEPLTNLKQEQLAHLSERRRRVSLPHARFWAKRQRKLQTDEPMSPMNSSLCLDVDSGDEEEDDYIYRSYDDVTTFENKTICLVSRYPYWTAFRRFLSHLHSISGCASDIPLERYISHLLLTVPVPKPGGPRILIPLQSFPAPLVLSLPPLKDLPLVDLPYERLVSCLDVPTIVTIVLGFLALERKVIVMSTRPSLVLDVCELLRSLIFPFDLCAPYVPRLTEPFMSCLDFPGAIFVGIHDDGSPNSLAAVVRKNMPEDSTIVDLDSGSIDCSGDRDAVLKSSWGALPPGPRSMLVSEIETLCRDASIEPGQEPLDSQIDSAFDVERPADMVEDMITHRNVHKEPLDGRGIRDAFLRFFCSVLGGYERFLVVPDVDFLISGNEWFDATSFLSSASEEKASFLGALVATQLFQEFIQRRTEASDVHCLLFDECLAEFHSTTVPYGRLGGDVETVQSDDDGQPYAVYSLLVDQSATIPHQTISANESFDADSKHGSETDSNTPPLNKSLYASTSDATDRLAQSAEFAVNVEGDWVTFPTRRGLAESARFLYCIDGNPVFPDELNPALYFPRQPESWLVEMSTAPTPMLTRSEKEVEEAVRRRKLATTYRGLQTQRRCLWQLPKLMGSHFLGTWLLCIPALVAQPHLKNEQQSKYLLRALGALRILRSKQRIVPDEAAYRSLIVACGRTRNDRRMELVKLFGLLRSDGIFPSAVTLGQYTRALAEGYSKQSVGTVDDDAGGSDGTEFAIRDLKLCRSRDDPGAALSALDGNLSLLEDAGRRWRQKHNIEKEAPGTSDEPQSSQEAKTSQSDRQKRRSSQKPWLPVLFSSSFVYAGQDDLASPERQPFTSKSVRIQTIWSRTKACDEEEIQAGWDVLGGENDIPGAINCPRCGAMLIPMLGYKTYSIDEALALAEEVANPSPNGTAVADYADLPPQIGPAIEETDAAYVTYVSPATMRSTLERLIEENGEDILERERLKQIDPELFYNLWWYCARFSLPLPLPVTDPSYDRSHNCAIIAWDHRVVTRGCYGCARVLSEFLDDNMDGTDNNMDKSELESFGDYPLMARFNLQGYYSTVWDHEDMSEILVTLVEACDKRDFRPVIECVLRRNKRRRDKYGGTQSNTSSTSDANSSFCLSAVRSDLDSPAMVVQNFELDCYRTILYLAKYQCTSAFHAFFPATVKPCKGYHFWCPIAPLPIFDRLLREAVKRIRVKNNTFAPFHDVSEVALGFRSVFGHLV